MKHGMITLLSLLIIIASCSDSMKTDKAVKLSDADRDEILTTFLATQDAWNEGSIEEFMKGYWKSDNLVFCGVTGPTYGYDNTLERYKKNYPDIETMGILKFKVIDLYGIDTRTALMTGQFYLSRTMGDIIGYYTLIWQKIDGSWLIISDHSSGQIINE